MLGRVRTYGFWGVPTPAPLSIDLRTLAAKRQCTYQNVRLLADSDVKLNGKYDPGQADIPLVPVWSYLYPDDRNTTAAWGGGTYLKEVPGAFGGEVNGLFHTLRDPTGEFVSYTSTFTDGKNESAANRLFLHKAPKEVKFPIWERGWDDWLFRIENGSAKIALKKRLFNSDGTPGALVWTQAKQDALDALLQDDATVDATLDERRAEIYEIYQSVGGNGIKLKTIEFYEIAFIPEPLGVLNIFLDGEHTQVKIARILDTREVGTVAAASTVTVRANGMPFMWQSGYPICSLTSSLEHRFRYRPVEIGSVERAAAIASMVPGGQHDTSLSGTAVSIVCEEIDSVWVRVKATLTTSNPRHMPFLYAAQANLPGGVAVHNAGQALSWDSNAHLLSAGVSRIASIKMSCENDSWRRDYVVEIVDHDGEAIDIGNNGEALLGRRVNLDAQGARSITQGIIRTASRNDIYNGRIFLTISDAWAILDEMEMPNDPIGDHKFLNDYIRQLLTDAGFPEWQLAGIPAGQGKKLPGAALGEPSAIRPRAHVFYGPYIRDTVDEWGMGARIYQDDAGVWTISSAVRTLAIGFTRVSNPTAMGASMSAMLPPFDRQYDTEEYFNEFLFEGFTNSQGKTLWATFSVVEGWKWGGGLAAQDQRHIGRKKRFYRKHEGIRTIEDLLWFGRSLVYRYSAPPRFFSFKSRFHKNLRPGMYDTVDSERMRLERIGGASLEPGTDSMDLVWRSLEPKQLAVVNLIYNGDELGNVDSVIPEEEE